ncbi:MAG: nucleotidyltransferase [Nitrospirae bacterium]|nr:nucleotidyltransferase [Nitrospirota bacterium]
MSEKKLSGLPFKVFRDFVRWIKTEKIPSVIIGGVAASILGRPRVTHDVDSLVIIDEAHLKEFVQKARHFGFIPRNDNILTFACKNRVLLMKHKPTAIDIDISLGALPFEHESIKRLVWTDVGGLKLPLSSPEDLIIMKAVAHRQRDLIDIEAIRDAHPNLNLKRIRKWVKEFSVVLEI